MASKHAMGNDPLDWIGKSRNRNGHSGNAAGSDDAGAGVGGADSRDGEAAVPPFGATPEVLDPFREPSALEGDATTSLSVHDSGAAVALERELLLLDRYEDGFHRPARRSSRSNQALLLLIFLFSFVGTAIFFYYETQRRWREQVRTLEAHVQSLERDRLQADRLVSSALASKDQIIAEREKTIALLRSSRTSRPGLEEAWRRLMRIGEQIRETLPGRSPSGAAD